MKLCLVILCLGILLGYPAVLRAEDQMFDPGQFHTTAPGAALTLGIWALTHPEEMKSLSEKQKEEPKKQDELDKKVDEAIKKAWEEPK